jgi:hypothetical protein|uniref:NET domain-containing protein n=1 Tax=viral metagenome TaxID=1070528 RepID=A0A6C0L7U4_9ZZZZ
MDKLEQLKNTIESMSKYHQIEILKILSKKLSKINENKSGCYINMSFLPEDTLKELEEYVGYIKDQEESLETMEYQKEEFKNAYFIEKENKDNPTILYSSLTK